MKAMLFAEKRKFITIPLILGAAVFLWPFLIGGGLAYLAHKKIPGKKAKYIAMSAVILLSLPFGSAWILAAASPSSPASAPTPSPTRTEEVAAAKTADPTQVPTVRPSAKPSSPTPAQLAGSIENRVAATVIKVVDGDTITVSLNGRNETVRIIGINTPETVDPRSPVECFGIEASNQAKKLFTDSQNTVWLEVDPSQGERDRYNRLLRYVFIQNGTVDYGRMMIAQGYAYEYTYGTPYKYQAVYKNVQQDAQGKELGLWNSATCNGQALESGRNISSPNPTAYTLSPIPQSASGGDKDCSDFTTHAEAQSFFIAQGGPASDPHRLDGSDNDGLACETLP